jgi:hypothetical protein
VGKPSVGEGKEEPLVITFTERVKDRFRSVSPIGPIEGLAEGRSCVWTQ